MKAILKGVVGLIVLTIALIILAPMLIPTETIVSQITSQVEKTTGRKLTISGDSELSILPELNITLNQVAFDNMPSGSAPHMLKMDQLAVHVPWFSLLSGEFQLERFVIQNPQILLEVDAQGRPNWQLFDPVAQSQTPESTATEAQSGPVTLPSGFDIALGEVAIYGGTITYADAQAGTNEQLTDLALSVVLPSLYQPLMIEGQVTFQKQRFDLALNVDTPAKAIQSEDFKFTKQLRNDLVNVDFNGGVLKQGSVFEGELAVSGSSVKSLTKWQNVVLDAKDNAFNQFEVTGAMTFSNNVFSLESFSAKLDELAIKGNAQVNLGERLSVAANVDLGMLNLNPYLPDPVNTTQPTKPEEEVAATPIVWDDTKIDLSALNMLDADIVVRSTGLQARKITLGKNQLSVKLDKGQAVLSLDSFNAYNGTGKGKVEVNAAATPYQIDTDFALNGINAEPLLTDAIGFDKVLGKGSLNWQLSTLGVSQKQFISQLAGKLAFEFKDGGVKGANLAEMVRKGQEMLKGNFSGLSEGINADFDPQQKTDFSALTGSFTFAKGIGTNRDLLLASPLIRITGSGVVDLPKTFVDYRLVTGIVDTIEGQSSRDKSTGFKIPARIKGPFHQVETSLDFSSAAKDKAKDTIKDKLKDKFKGLFGG
ncbi:AsmA family protein [Pseudoalteromonas sp. Of7M-16]|uniref:AsmA family protein n=1 Tax=Pseudoalteromonas sp. Of7M-16 TaxID=2917756 RepID=UPI001EF69856|nr:AsmA family protein [Pseudoalteromonas sp. Of7M-16]MCG7551398.1 AsmA family protein [Pseudoalteromonas sp. Of7M-16]